MATNFLKLVRHTHKVEMTVESILFCFGLAIMTQKLGAQR